MTATLTPRPPTGPRSSWRVPSGARPVLIVALAVAASGCAGQPRIEAGSGRGAVTSIDTVLARHSDEWMAVPGVVGTGLGQCGDARCITIFVIERSEEIERRIPARVEGHLVSIVVSGRPRPRT